MQAELKIYITGISTFIAGLLISHGVGDASQSNAIASTLNTIFGDLMDLGSALYILETLLVKHKAEVADNYYTAPEPTEPIEPEKPDTTTTTAPATPAV